MHLIQACGARLYLLGLVALLAVPSPVRADVPATPPPSWIHDGAGLLKPSELTELTALRVQLEQQTGARLVVVTLSAAGGESPKSIAVRTLNAWNAGRKSALLLVLLSPRALYIQPGTDLAQALDSSNSSAICSGVVAPKLRSGERAAAIRAGLEAIAARITAAAVEPVAQASSGTTSPTSDTPPLTLSTFPTREFSEPRVFEWVGYGGGLAGLVAGAWGLSRLMARKCKECGQRMTKSSSVTLSPTYSSTGEGLHTFSCGFCSYSFSETYFISQLVESTTTSNDSTSNDSTSWSSSSSDSFGSSSSSDSSSSSSSDSSGGGGSDW